MLINAMSNVFINSRSYIETLEDFVFYRLKYLCILSGLPLLRESPDSDS